MLPASGTRAPDGKETAKASRLRPISQRSLRERVGALRNLPQFLRLVWQAAPGLTAGNLALRLVRALLPVAMLYVGKLIIDEVIRLAGISGAPDSLTEWLYAGLLDRLLWLLAIELGLAVLADLLGRGVLLVDSLLSERFSSATSIRLMEHAATLDLEDFEDTTAPIGRSRSGARSGARCSRRWGRWATTWPTR